VAKEHIDADAALRALKSTAQPFRGRDCPPDETWLHLSAGLMEDLEAARHLQHAARCDWCGKLLREAVEDMAQDVTPEEQAALDRLSSAQPGWQRDLAEKLARTSAAAGPTRDVPARPAKTNKGRDKQEAHFAWWPKSAWAAASLLVAVGLLSVGWLQVRVPVANRLLARAYTKQRLTDLRMADAGYGAVQAMHLGAGSNKFPQEFHWAKAILPAESAKHQEDPAWLQAQARADLFEWDYQAAIQELDHALRLRPNDPALLLDRAMAYFERGQKENPSYYSRAEQDLSQVLKANPRHPVARFNRALVYERMQSPHEAISDLQFYLQVDPSGPWAEEARKRLEKLQEKVKEKKDALDEPLDVPSDFLRGMGNPDEVAHVDQRIEDYLDLALREWLPAAYSRPELDALPGTRTAASALGELAEKLAERHHDKWLHDLLNSSSNNPPAFAAAVAALSAAVQKSNEGDPDAAESESRRAAGLFEKASSQAGIWRASLEQVHAFQRAQRGEDCLAHAKALEPALRAHAYPWMQAQLDIDQCSCSIMTQSFNQARRFAKQAEDEAKAGAYRTLQLRRMGIEAAVDTDEGNISAAWALDLQGLQEYWDDKYTPAIRGQQFYTDLSLAAEDLQQYGAALALAREGERAISLTDNKSLQALTRVLVAREAFYAQDFKLANAAIRDSSRLLAALPDSKAANIYRMDADIDLAGLEMDMDQERLPAAEARLASAEPHLNSGEPGLNRIKSYTIPLRFYETYGRLLEIQKKFPAAEAKLQQAVGVASPKAKQLKTQADLFAWSQGTSKLYRRLVQVEFEKLDPGRALAVWEHYLSSRVYGASPNSKFDPEELDKRLASVLRTLTDRTVVSYAVLPQDVAVWVFDSRGSYGLRLGLDPEQTKELAARFVRLCADPASDLSQLKSHAASLYEMLIVPVEDWLKQAEAQGNTIVIESDDLLGPLPFEAFVIPTGQYRGQYWGSVVRVNYSPGVFSEQQLRASSNIARGSKALIVASSVSTDLDGQQLDSIGPQVEEEAAAVAQKFDHPTILKGSHASFAEVEAALPAVEVFQYGGHALSNGTQEGLLLLKSEPSSAGKPGLWGARRITPALMRRLQLAVFAACSTGQTTTSRLETRGEMVRSTLSAGVPHIVASRWDVDSAVTKQFTDLLYSGLLSGQTVSAALAGAEGHLRGNADTQHPYYWASFAAFGRSN